METSSQRRTVLIIGAGPAGLTAAIAAAEAGQRVILCEQLDRPGAKLLASGGGRCNLSNSLPEEQFMSAFGRQGRFMAPALAALSQSGLRAFIARLGVPTVVDKAGGVYPASQSAVDVQAALWRRCRELHVNVRLATRAMSLVLANGRLGGIVTSDGPLTADAVVLATGGCGYPSLGGSRTGYDLARQAGHEVVPPTPALSPLVAAEKWIRRCAGLAVVNARLRIDLPGESAVGQRGQLLFTHRGLSGPAALNISGQVASLLTKRQVVPLLIELAADRPVGDWRGMIDHWSHDNGARMLRTLLGETIPNRLVEVILDLASVPRDARVSQVPRAGRDQVAALLAGLPLTIRATEGFEHAMVTRGGVSLKQVDPRTLGSRLVGGLFFAGELLDLAGPTGGFNLQWAFSSGLLAGTSAAAWIQPADERE